ncbi:hypothetical protein [Niabella ginsengisoli]|uniref:Uncharacterized protein n=1 Tax=Niabella ginsengisoli TaxID=522298 RepID=A0ABS9SR39_9BACT|nr:hypothetical protein [Niabella ginsengisoli]MCH5600852.1 hypothetical protein [Niabella ginsengisoli]
MSYDVFNNYNGSLSNIKIAFVGTQKDQPDKGVMQDQRDNRHPAEVPLRW